MKAEGFKFPFSLSGGSEKSLCENTHGKIPRADFIFEKFLVEVFLVEV